MARPPKRPPPCEDDTLTSSEEDLTPATSKEYLCTSIISGRELSVADVTVDRLFKDDMLSIVSSY